MRYLAVVAAVVLAAGCAAKNDAAATKSSRRNVARGPAGDDTITQRDATIGANTTAAPLAASNRIPWPWGPFDTLYNKPIDSKYRLLLARETDDVSHKVTLRVKLLELVSAGRVWDIARLPADFDFGYRALRADSTSIVLSRTGDYGRSTSLKLFLEPGSKKLIKQVDFSPWTGLDSIPDEDVAAALSLPEALVRPLKERDPRRGPEEPWDKYLPKALKDHPMPSSTYADFARERPKRVEDGYDSTSEIGEMPGPVQVEPSRIWFGKTFYDGEGASGVGGVGYFDTIKSTYTFLKIPEMAPWSVSALLVDDQILWIGLVGHPEGSDYSGGLLRHDLKTGETKKVSIDEVILRIKRWNSRTYLATAGGAWVIEGDRLVARYLAEPDLTGKLVLVRVDPL